ncbi:hypothetical protein [Rhodococcus sp. 06-1460-1B]|uniref:hypothetical protein n=1 Tax=Rhodococcus sp. 06-1460-1B TaxID=2022501 RepID=UPI0020CC67C5|nr:hypothetical protein [Rhodococcus sp. 06-1460-1B]
MSGNDGLRGLGHVDRVEHREDDEGRGQSQPERVGEMLGDRVDLESNGFVVACARAPELVRVDVESHDDAPEVLGGRQRQQGRGQHDGRAVLGGAWSGLHGRRIGAERLQQSADERVRIWSVRHTEGQRNRHVFTVVPACPCDTRHIRLT